MNPDIDPMLMIRPEPVASIGWSAAWVHRNVLIKLISRSKRHWSGVDRAKGEFKKAPSFNTDVELSMDDEAATFRHYGLEYTPAGEGARRLAKR